MTAARTLFIGADGRPHPPWRLLLFLVLSVACVIVVSITLRPILLNLQRLSGIPGTADAYGMTLSLLLAHWMTFRTYDQRPWSFVWLDRHAAEPTRLVKGTILGAAPIGLMSLLLLAVGLLALVPTPDGPATTVALQILLLLLPAAFYEELLSRGYLFATLAQWLGRRQAVFVTSVGFGLLHLGNAGATALSVSLVTLAGVYLAVILLVTQSLYAAWLAHLAWNWVMAALLHVPVSGLSLAQPDYKIVDAGPDWITGGSWGPEGGVGAAVGMLAGLGYLYWRRSGPRALGSEAHSPQPTAQSIQEQ